MTQVCTQNTYKPVSTGKVLWLLAVVIVLTTVGGLMLAGIDAHRHPWKPTIVDLQGCNDTHGSNAPCVIEDDETWLFFNGIDSQPNTGYTCKYIINRDSLINGSYECKER